jgi:hypothetical protein
MSNDNVKHHQRNESTNGAARTDMRLKKKE